MNAKVFTQIHGAFVGTAAAAAAATARNGAYTLKINHNVNYKSNLLELKMYPKMPGS